MNEVGVTVESTEQELVLRLSGELDLATALACRRRLFEATATVPPPYLIVVDLTELGFLAAAGIRVLLTMAAAAAGRDVDTRVVTTHPTMRRILGLDEVQHRLLCFDTVADATSAERRRA